MESKAKRKPPVLKKITMALLRKPQRKATAGLKLIHGKQETFDAVRGWITLTNQRASGWLFEWQNAHEPDGDLVGLGAYEGKSAIVIGSFLKGRESFTVCDLFEAVADEQSISIPVREYYASLTRKTFEDNYLKFHDSLPRVVRGLSSSILEHVKSGICRFVHIDASHQYEHVRQDTKSAKALLRRSGIVVFDDYRTQHTPGTAASAWEAVINDGLQPICATSGKLYGTWGDVAPLQAHIVEKASRSGYFSTSLVNVPHGRKNVYMLRTVPSEGQEQAAGAASQV